MSNELRSYYIKIFKTSLRRLKFNFKNFGVKVAVMNFLGEMAYFKKFKDFRISKYFLRKQEEIVCNALEERFSDLVEEYKNKKVEIGENSKIIWFFRWEGIREDNVVVKKSYESIKKHAGDYKVIVVTEENYLDYVDLPEKIINKVNEGRITIPKLVDILKAKFLNTYGGIWPYTTMLFFDDVFDEFDDIVFNSHTGGPDWKWGTYFLGGKPNKLYAFLYDFYSQYHLEYEEVIDYFIVDHGFRIAYKNFEECREYIDNVTLYNPGIFYFLEHFSETYDKEEFDRVCREYKFFKISDKPSVNAKEYDNDGNLTNYGYFKYKLKF